MNLRPIPPIPISNFQSPLPKSPCQELLRNPSHSHASKLFTFESGPKLPLLHAPRRRRSPHRPTWTSCLNMDKMFNDKNHVQSATGARCPCVLASQASSAKTKVRIPCHNRKQPFAMAIMFWQGAQRHGLVVTRNTTDFILHCLCNALTCRVRSSYTFDTSTLCPLHVKRENTPLNRVSQSTAQMQHAVIFVCLISCLLGSFPTLTGVSAMHMHMGSLTGQDRTAIKRGEGVKRDRYVRLQIPTL